MEKMNEYIKMKATTQKSNHSAQLQTCREKRYEEFWDEQKTVVPFRSTGRGLFVFKCSFMTREMEPFFTQGPQSLLDNLLGATCQEQEEDRAIDVDFVQQASFLALACPSLARKPRRMIQSTFQPWENTRDGCKSSPGKGCVGKFEP